MQGELERGDDAEVAASALERPQQVGVLVRAGADQAPVGGDDLGRDQVVDAQAMAAAQPADAAAERQAGDAGVRDQAARHREPEGLGLAIDVAPGRAALDPGAAPLRIDPHAAHRREIDHHAVVADRVARDVVAATADRDRQVVLAGERDRVEHIVRAPAADDHGRAAVDHRVPHRASGVVGLVAGDQDVSPDRAPQLLENRLVQAPGVGIRCFVSAAHSAPLSNRGLTESWVDGAQPVLPPRLRRPCMARA